MVASVEAALAHSGTCDKEFAAAFADMTVDRAAAALDLACELKLLTKSGSDYTVTHPMASLLRTPQVAEKAAVLRIVLEKFEPFVVFRQELDATADATIAATRAKTTLDLQPHREDVKTTLLDLATFSGALKSTSGGKYERDVQGLFPSLKELAAGATEKAAAVLQVREILTAEFANTLSVDDVIDPLGDALRHASGGNSREAVVHAGNAVESYLTVLSVAHQIGLVGATGLNAKLDRFDQAHSLPKKLIFVGKYLGHVRNAADHGVDADVGRSWTIQNGTGLNYVYVSLSFLRSTKKHYDGLSDI
jgi:hypothetical protein